MKKSLWIVLLCLSFSAGFAFAPHPTVLTAKYKDLMLPVVKVIGTDPVVIHDGQEKRIRLEPVYLLQRAPHYSKTTAEIVSANLSTRETRMVATPNDAQGVIAESQGPRFGMAHFDFIFKAGQHLRGGFVVVVIYSKDSLDLSSKFSRPEVVVHDLPELAAGAATTVNFTSAIPNGRAQPRFFAQIFDAEGREVMTNKTPEAWQFYYVMERAQLNMALPKYLKQYAGANHAVTPVLMPHPSIPAGITTPAGPVSAMLTISADGFVTKVDLPELGDTDLQKAVADALGGWMFFPQLSAGNPVESKVQVPLQF